MDGSSRRSKAVLKIYETLSIQLLCVATTKTLYSKLLDQVHAVLKSPQVQGELISRGSVGMETRQGRQAEG